MNQKSLKDLKNLTSEFIKNPKLIDKLDDIIIDSLERRLLVSRMIGKIKKKKGLNIENDSKSEFNIKQL